jgi:LacI family gluconate utilization system Gnt-I transcriptional repressor
METPAANVPTRTEHAPRRRRTSRATGNITLEDVAKLAGVSTVTVSRAIHRPELVAAGTIARVRDVVERTGYVPNLVAGALASRRTRLVAAIVPSVTNSVFVDTVQALANRLWIAGYQVLLGLSGYPATREEALLTSVLSRRPDAVCLAGIARSRGTRARLLSARIPVVEIWDMTPTPIDMLVGFSHERIGAAVAAHLVDRGHRRLGIVWADDTRALDRQRGFLAELARLACAQTRVVTVPAPSRFSLGRHGLAQLLDHSHDAPTAVFCSSDVLAHGVLEEARARGISIPREMAVVGFGDLDFAAHTHPALSTVRVDRANIGLRAAELILARIAGDHVIESVVDVGFEIVDRGTT